VQNKWQYLAEQGGLSVHQQHFQLYLRLSFGSCCAVSFCVQVWGLCEAPVPRLTLPVRANVCSIKFSPAAPHMLAAGNAGHQVCVCVRLLGFRTATGFCVLLLSVDVRHT
jgi:hypothetical protein